MTYIVSDPAYQKHLVPYNIPEKPTRHAKVEEALIEKGLLREDNRIVPFVPPDCYPMYCHVWDYVFKVRNEAQALASGAIAPLSTDPKGDTNICRESYEVALLAVGGVLRGVDYVMQGVCKRVFCNVRPPGHHAESRNGMGFCLFNNVAIGAVYALVFGIQRVAILDWDVHHGNGTQEIFYAIPSVHYFSTHQQGHYPGTGSADERGQGLGLGCTYNVPILPGKGSGKKVVDAVRTLWAKEMDAFKPQLVMISAGFDGHKSDPYGNFDLTAKDFANLTKIVVEVAEKYAEGRVVSVLEGGYNLKSLASSAVAHVEALKEDISAS